MFLHVGKEICLGCGRPRGWLCEICELQWWTAPREVSSNCELLMSKHGTSLLPVWAFGQYKHNLQHAILAWKRGEAPKMNQYLARLMSPALVKILFWWEIESIDQARGESIWGLVPSPSGINRQIQGLTVVEDIAKELVKQTNRLLCMHRLSLDENLDKRKQSNQTRLVYLPLLKKRISLRIYRSQKRQIKQDRYMSRAGSMCPILPDFGGQKLVIIDDVITTGSTLWECSKVLKRKNSFVKGALVVATARL